MECKVQSNSSACKTYPRTIIYSRSHGLLYVPSNKWKIEKAFTWLYCERKPNLHFGKFNLLGNSKCLRSMQCKLNCYLIDNEYVLVLYTVKKDVC